MLFTDQLGLLAASDPSRHQLLLGGLDAGTAAALQYVAEFAEKQRQVLAKQAEEKAAAA